MYRLLTAAFSLWTAGLAVSAGDWPHWRGPGRNGVSAEAAWRHEWPAEGPRVVWKGKVGLGFSSVVVAGGRLFTLGHEDEQDTLFCFDAVSGKEVWRHAYPAELGDKFFEGGTTGTPTVAGDAVYLLSRWGDVFCVDAGTGKVRWEKNVVRDAGARPPDWGFSGAPLVLGDRVYLNVGESGMALDRGTGSVVWKSAAKEAGYSTPLPLGGADGPAAAVAGVAVFSSGTGYTAVRLADGTPTWSVRWLTQYGVNAADPIVRGDSVFVSTGYGKGAGLFRLGAGAAEPEVVWKSKVLATQMNPPVLFEGHLYGVDGDTTAKASLKCVELATGKEAWAHPGFGSGGLMVAGGRLIAINGTGEILTAPATPQGFRPTARAQVLGGKTWTAPVLANGFLYCRSARGEVVCLDLRASGS